jgi:hypothetical protein
VPLAFGGKEMPELEGKLDPAAVLDCLGQVVGDEVYDFCTKNNVGRYLGLAVELARATFSSITKLETRLQEDPEADHISQRIVIDVTVSQDTAKTLAEKRAFTRQWVELAPADVREKIRLLYHFA